MIFFLVSALLLSLTTLCKKKFHWVPAAVDTEPQLLAWSVCACIKCSPAVTFYMFYSKYQVVCQVFSKPAQGDCSWRDLPCFITMDGSSPSLCYLPKFKTHVINSENTKSILALASFQWQRMEAESFRHGLGVVPPI